MVLARLVVDRLRPYGGLVLALTVLQVISVATQLYLPNLNADILDIGVLHGDQGYIWREGSWMLLVTIVQMLAAVGSAYVGAQLAMAIGRDLRAVLFGKVAELSGREVNQFGTPSLITRSTNDTRQIQVVALMGCTIMASVPIIMVGGVVMALREDLSLSWLMIVAMLVLGVVVGVLVSRMIPGFRLMQQRIDRVNTVLREHLTGIRVIRAFAREPQERERFGEANDELTDVGIRVGALMMTLFPSVFLIMDASTIAVWWFGAHQIDEGTVQVGSLTAYMTYLLLILSSVMMATVMVMMIPRAAVSAERITQVLHAEPSVAPPDAPQRAEKLQGIVELDHVSMCYPGAEHPVIAGVSLRATPGQTIAIVGSTGSGKTTLLSVIARLLDATTGRVLVDGIDVRELEPTDLWGHLGLVPQHAYLFSGTVESNLRFGSANATDEQLWDALRVAQADAFVAALEDGLAAPVAQGGVNFSGGQRQRLCIARALLVEASIYLFDDSFSALDLTTDAKVRAAMAPRLADATVFIVAQRLSTIAHADQIVVLDGGEVVGLGTDEQLRQSCPAYREMALSQGTGVRA